MRLRYRRRRRARRQAVARPASSAPWHLWLVSAVSLLWNAFGALQYTMAQLRQPTYLARSAEGMGIKPAELTAYLAGFPAWSVALWALGVWGALAGSALLFARSRFAIHAFAVSLAGLAGTQAYQAIAPRPAWAAPEIGFTLAIWSIAIGLLLYALALRRRGSLR